MKISRYIIGALLMVPCMSCSHPAPLPAQVKKVQPKPRPTTPLSYQHIDSVRVMALLAAGDSLAPEINRPLFFGRQLRGIPYVSNTLEKGDAERLRVNLRGLDCTTFVETVTALTLTNQQHGAWKDYLRNLESVRYHEGRLNGYCSRLHYFSMWIADNITRKNVDTVDCGKVASARMWVNLYFMSKHPRRYRHLRNHPERIDSLRTWEKKFSDYTVHFIPSYKLNGNRKELSCIHDGDILAIVVGRKGLDYSHLGFAAWGKDGKVHLLNASFLHKKVVEEPMSLFAYMKHHPSQRGVCVVRIREKE